MNTRSLYGECREFLNFCYGSDHLTGQLRTVLTKKLTTRTQERNPEGLSKVKLRTRFELTLSVDEISCHNLVSLRLSLQLCSLSLFEIPVVAELLS